MGCKVFLCASAYPKREETIKRIGIDIEDSIDGFVKAIGRNEILPFLGAYQRMVYTYSFFKKLIKEYKVDLYLLREDLLLFQSQWQIKPLFTFTILLI